MKRTAFAAITCLLIASSAMARPMSQEAQWYGSETGGIEAGDGDLQGNMGLIRDCLKENKGSARENCIGITKSYCHAEQPTCNIQEAQAWDALAGGKRSGANWKRTLGSCHYSQPVNGYAGINPRDPWADKLAPSGCVLQHSARRYLQKGAKPVHHKKVVHKKVAPKPVVQVEPAQTVAPAPAPATPAPQAAAPQPVAPVKPVVAPAPAPVAAPATAPQAVAPQPAAAPKPMPAPQPAAALPVTAPAPAPAAMPPLPAAHP